MTRRLSHDNDIEDGDFIDVEPEDITNIQEDIDNQLNAMFSEFGGDDDMPEFKIRVYRPIKNSAELSYCFSCSPSDLPILDRLRDEWNGGQFEVRIYKDGKIFKRRKLFVEAPPAQRQPERQQSDMQPVLAAMSSMADRMERLMEQRQPQPQQTDPFAMITQMAQAMQTMQGLTPQPQQRDPVDLLVTGMKLARESGGGSGDDTGSNVFDLLKSTVNTFGGPLASAMEKISQMPMQPVMPGMNPAGAMPMQPAMPHIPTQPPAPVHTSQPVMQPNPAPRHEPTQPAPSTQTTEQENDMDYMLKMQLGLLVNYAKKGVDVEGPANTILDAMGDNEVSEFINRPGALDELVKVNPEVAKHRAWFEDLKNCINDMLTNDEPAPDNQGDLNPGPDDAPITSEQSSE